MYDQAGRRLRRVAHTRYIVVVKVVFPPFCLGSQRGPGFAFDVSIFLSRKGSLCSVPWSQPGLGFDSCSVFLSFFSDFFFVFRVLIFFRFRFDTYFEGMIATRNAAASRGSTIRSILRVQS